MEYKTGLFFKSDSDIQNFYFVEFDVKQEGYNVVAKIYLINDNHPFDAAIGDVLVYHLIHLERYCSIDIWNKYYFPSWPGEMYQWYHDFDKDGKGDEIKAMHDVMQYALSKGIELGKIELY